MSESEAKYKPTEGLTKAVTTLLSLCMVVAAVSVATDIMQLELLMRIDSGGDWTMAEAETNDLWFSRVGLLYAAVYIITGITFLVWLYRVRANLPALGITDARWGPGWAVGWWLVPIMNFFRPYQVVKEVWQASRPEATPEDWRQARRPPLIPVWWAAFLISMVLSNIAGRLAMRGGETMADFLASTTTFLASDAIDVVAIIPAILIVREIHRQQSARHAALAEADETAPPQDAMEPVEDKA